MTSLSAEDIRLALIRADPRLSRFKPLLRIVFHDDFDDGNRGWTELIGNYDYALGQWRNPDSWMIAETRPPMLSTSSFWDTGTDGAMDGTYALKIATRPKKGFLAKALKRITWQQRGLLQCEAYFTYRVEASELVLGERDFQAFGMSYDYQDQEQRWWPAFRYLNAEDGEVRGVWQVQVSGTHHPHFGGWEDVGEQLLCYNEIPTKQNWHYLRWLIDLGAREYVELQCNDRVFDLRGKTHRRFPELHKPNLWNLLNVGFWAEAGADKRCWLLLDSVVVSTDA